MLLVLNYNYYLLKILYLINLPPLLGQNFLIYKYKS